MPVGWFPAWFLLVLLSVIQHVRAADYWLSPPGSPGNGATVYNCSTTLPLPWTTAFVQQIIIANPKSTSDATVVLWLKPGTYLIDQLTLTDGTNGTPSNRVLVMRAETATQAPVFRYQVPTTAMKGFANSQFLGPEWGTWLFQLADRTLARFEAHDLVLDGNWPAWAATKTGACPAYVGGFALGALRAKADAGLIRNVRVKNCGANGVTPWPHWVDSGRECFPLWVHAAAYANNAWTVEDSEVSDFHSLHQGYGSAIMVTTDAPPPGSSTTDRVVTVRRCQVRGWGPEIAFGTAGSERVSFRDNVAVGVGLGLNADSAPIRNIDLQDSLFLDVSALANIGSANSYPDSGVYRYSDFDLSRNAIRLRSVPLLQDYRSFQWRNVTLGTGTYFMPVSDPTLALGRYYTGYCASVRLAGAHDISFHDNRFTTRPIGYFYEPNPSQTTLANWAVAIRATTDPLSGLPCDQTGTFGAIFNWVSGTAMDFQAFTYLSGDPVTLLPALSGWGVLTWDQNARVGRVQPSYSPTGYLVSAREVRVKKPDLVGGLVRVEAGIVVHDHSSGLPWNSSTLDLPGVDDLRLEVRRAGGQVSVQAPNSVVDGVAVFTYTPESGPGRDELVVYGRGPGGVGVVPADPYTTAWTTTEYLRHPVIRFERVPDVADDRRLYPGYLRLSRSGSVSADLSVILTRQGDGFPRPATVGMGMNDFLLYQPSPADTNVWLVCPANGDTWTVTIPAGRPELLLRVVSSSGAYNQDQAEYEAAHFQIAPSTTGTYATAPAAPWTTPAWTTDAYGNTTAAGVAVTLWDGPKWRLYQLSDTYQPAQPPPLALPSGEPDDPVIEDSSAHDPLTTTEIKPVVDSESPSDQGLSGYLVTRTGERIQIENALPLSQELAQLDPDDGSQRYAPATLWTEGGREEEMHATPDSPVAYYGYGGAAYAVSDAGTSTPIAGYLMYNNVPPLSGFSEATFSLAGIWRGLTTAEWAWFLDAPVSQFAAFGVSGAGDFVGGRRPNDWPNLVAPWHCSASGTFTSLPRRATDQAKGCAFALSGDGNWVVGYTLSTAWKYVPTRWQRQANGAWTLPAGNLTCADPSHSGFAHDVNSSGVAVGRLEIPSGGSSYPRAFRVSDGSPVHAMTHGLQPPAASNGGEPRDTWANAVDSASNVVGWSDAMVWVGGGNYQKRKRAVIWWASTAIPTVLGGMHGVDLWPINAPLQSEALGISPRDGPVAVVGSSSLTGQQSNGLQNAFWQWVEPPSNSNPGGKPGKMLNLNDAHLAWLPVNWVLVTAEDLNNRDWIVGSGTFNAMAYAYVLVPQTLVGY